MEIELDENETFKALISGSCLNSQTVGSLMKEVLNESVGPGGIAVRHFNAGQGSWPKNSPATLKAKGAGKPIFQNTGGIFKAISTPTNKGQLFDWGSSADIFSTSRGKKKRYSANGMYASITLEKDKASLTIGFNGRYKHSAGFNKERRKLAVEKSGKKKLTAKEVRKLISVGETERRVAAINADRKARGLKIIRKSAAMGSQGIQGNKHVLARGKDNKAYGDLVQRGRFHGIRTAKGQLFSPKGISAMARGGAPVSGKLEFGKARPLLPYKPQDYLSVGKALNRGWENIAKELNSAGR